MVVKQMLYSLTSAQRRAGDLDDGGVETVEVEEKHILVVEALCVRRKRREQKRMERQITTFN